MYMTDAFISNGLVGGTIVFGLYYLFYTFNKKNFKEIFKPLSIIVVFSNFYIVMRILSSSNNSELSLFYFFVLYPSIAIGTILVSSFLVSIKMFLLLVLLNAISLFAFLYSFDYASITINMQFMQFNRFIESISGGGVVFGLYYLFYILIIKKTGSIKVSSLLLRIPLFIGCIYISREISSIYMLNIIDNVDVSRILFIIISTIIASFAISFFEYRKKMISLKIFLFVFFFNAIPSILYRIMISLDMGHLIVLFRVTIDIIYSSITVGTLAFSFFEYKKQLIPLHRFRLVFSLNAIPLLISWYRM